MAAARYNWPLSAPFDPNNVYHQGWAIVSYLGGVFVAPNPQFNHQDEVHRSAIFKEIAAALNSPLRYNGQMPGSLELARFPANNITQVASQPDGGHTGQLPLSPEPADEPYEDEYEAQLAAHIAAHKAAAGRIAFNSTDIDPHAHLILPPNIALSPDPAFAARLAATKGSQGYSDNALGRFVLREADQLLQSDIESLGDIIEDSIGYARMTEEKFLVRVFGYPLSTWNSSIATEGEASPIKKTKQNAAGWPAYCRSYNLELCRNRARHRLYTWYSCGPAIPIGGQGVPIYTAIPNERAFVPKLA